MRHERNFGQNTHIEDSQRQRMIDLLKHLPFNEVSNKIRIFRSKGINPQNFPEYDQREVTEMLRELQRIERDIQSQAQNEIAPGFTEGDSALLGEYAEFLVYEGMNRGWIPFCSAIKTSRYDDVKRKVDLVLEYSNEAIAHIGLGIDVTFSRPQLVNKMRTIKQEIDTGRLTNLEFFESKTVERKGRLLNIPRVVVGIDLAAMRDLHDQNSPEDHPIGHSILLQIRMQLRALYRYTSQDQPQLAGQISQPLKLIENLVKMNRSEYKYRQANYTKNQAMESEIESVINEVFQD